VPHGYASFFAAGAFTCKLDTLPLLLRKQLSSMNKFSRCIFVQIPAVSNRHIKYNKKGSKVSRLLQLLNKAKLM